MNFRSSLLIHPDELDEIWIDTVSAMGVDTIGLHPVGGGGADRSFAAAVALSRDPHFRSLVDLAQDRGIAVEYEMHALRYFLPESEFSAHPDWFRADTSGTRTPDRNCCASNPEGLAFIAERAAEADRKLYRGRKAISHRRFYWTDDAHDAFCSCPGCRSLSPSDQQMRIMNAILRRLRQDDPQAELAFLAYDVCTAPPVQAVPEEGIFLEIAPMTRDFHKPLKGSDDPRNTQRCEDIEALLGVFGTENVKVLDYWLDNSLYSRWTKPPKPFTADVPVMRADIRYYRSLGIGDISSFACFLGADYRALHGTPDISPFGKAIREIR